MRYSIELGCDNLATKLDSFVTKISKHELGIAGLSLGVYYVLRSHVLMKMIPFQSTPPLEGEGFFYLDSECDKKGFFNVKLRPLL